MGKREASHFITEYYTEGGKVELMIPTDATYDDFALLKDILAIVETKLKQRADRNSSEKPNNFDKDINVRSKTEPQTCSVNGRPYSECGRCEHFKCTADEPQTERSK